MKTVRIKIYKFNELSEEAKQNAIDYFRSSNDYFYMGSEILDSINRGLDHFGGELSDYSIDWQNINNSTYLIKYSVSEDIQQLSGVRLWKYLNNSGLLHIRDKYNKKIIPLLSGNCPLTGVCFDESFLDAVRNFIARPSDISFTELMEDCVYNTIKAGCNDCEYQQSEEAIIETIEANEYDFKDDGTIF